MNKLKEKVLIIGAGRTGRGMLGEMFFLDGYYELIFADYNMSLVDELKTQGYYDVKKTNLSSGESSTTRVTTFKVYHTIRDRKEYLDAIVEATIVLTAVFPDAFEQVAIDLADGINLRAKSGNNSPILILLGSNYVGHHEAFFPIIWDRLSEKARDYYDHRVSLVGINANRKVTHGDQNLNGKLSLFGDDKKILQVDNKIHHKDIYLPEFIKLVENLDSLMAEKIWSANLEHCAFGFLGAFYGYETINQAVMNARVKSLAYYAWKESRRALQIKFRFPIPSLEVKQKEYQNFTNLYFHDKISRIARDPIRKLSRRDRFIGPALLCLECDIMPYFILKCAAYGFFYDNSADQSSQLLQSIIAKEGLEQAIVKVCQLNLLDRNDKIVFDLILSNSIEISKRDPFDV